MSNVFLKDSQDSMLKMHGDGENEYWFYHKGSYTNDNPLLYQKLINNATREIIIWDPYFNVDNGNSDQQIFSNIKKDITIKILTFKGLDCTHSYLTKVLNAMKNEIPPSKDCRFALRVINKGDSANQGGFFFHDRFLIIDNINVYLVGGSIGFHIGAKQSTGIYRVVNPETSKFIVSIFQEYWNNSSKYEIPLTYLHL